MREGEVKKKKKTKTDKCSAFHPADSANYPLRVGYQFWRRKKVVRLRFTIAGRAYPGEVVWPGRRVLTGLYSMSGIDGRLVAAAFGVHGSGVCAIFDHRLRMCYEEQKQNASVVSLARNAGF